MNHYKLTGIALAVAFFFFGVTTSVNAQSGHILNGVGPIDQSMAGAGMANPQDILTGLHWNPATATLFEGVHLDASIQFLQPTGTITSSVQQGAFGPFGPPQDLAGSTDSDAGPFPIPAVGVLYAPEGQRYALGFNAFGVGGFGVDYPLDPTNPILTPQPPGGLGFGSIVSEFALLQLSPSVAYKLTDEISFGIAPTLNYATLKVTPFPAAAPDDANGDGFPSYPAGPKDAALGFGAQAGVHYVSPSGLQLGLSVKSEQSFQDFEMESVNESGGDRTIVFALDYPMIVSGGIGYSGIENVELAADVRYVTFSDTKGFDATGYNPDGSVAGFGWDDILIVAVGGQYQVSPRGTVRLGYSFNQNPIPDELSFFNTPAPAIIQHHIGGGFSVGLSENVTASAAVQYGAKNTTEGVWVTPQGANPGTMVENELSTLTFIVGVSAKLK